MRDIKDYTEPKIKYLNFWENPDYALGLGIPDKSDEIKQIKFINEYTSTSFEHAKTSDYINENQEKIWFWKNISFIFSIGTVFEDNDRLLLNRFLGMFDKTQAAFLPNLFMVYDWTDERIKKFESLQKIGNGNYHILLIIYNTADSSELSKAPESLYKQPQLIKLFVNIEDIVTYLCDVINKYGAIKSLMTDTVSNLLKLRDSKVKIQTARIGNPTSFNPRSTNPIRLTKEGYLDINANDTFELINPEQDLNDFAPHRDALRPADLGITDSDVYSRRQVKTVQRETLTNTGKDVKRSKGKFGLYSQIHGTQDIGATYVDSTVKGGMMRVNTYYRSLSDQEENPNYKVYKTDKDEKGGKDRIQYLYESDINEIDKREEIPILRTTETILSIPTLPKQTLDIPVEQLGIFKH